MPTSLSPPDARRDPAVSIGSLRERARDPRAYIQLAERLSYWMDRRYVDPILGLVLPGAGDAIGAGIGLLGIYAAYKLRAHPIVIARMLLNLAIDSLLGSIPVLGVVIDFVFRANTRNLDGSALRARAGAAVDPGGGARRLAVALTPRLG
jgi:uncharacterized protein DUF4112